MTYKGLTYDCGLCLNVSVNPCILHELNPYRLNSCCTCAFSTVAHSVYCQKINCHQTIMSTRIRLFVEHMPCVVTQLLTDCLYYTQPCNLSHLLDLARVC